MCRREPRLAVGRIMYSQYEYRRTMTAQVHENHRVCVTHPGLGPGFLLPDDRYTRARPAIDFYRDPPVLSRLPLSSKQHRPWKVSRAKGQAMESVRRSVLPDGRKAAKDGESRSVGDIIRHSRSCIGNGMEGNPLGILVSADSNASTGPLAYLVQNPSILQTVSFPSSLIILHVSSPPIRRVLSRCNRRASNSKQQDVQRRDLLATPCASSSSYVSANTHPSKTAVLTRDSVDCVCVAHIDNIVVPNQPLDQMALLTSPSPFCQDIVFVGASEFSPSVYEAEDSSNRGIDSGANE